MTSRWFTGLYAEFRDSLSSTISFPADYFAGWFGVAPSESGVEVNELTAMQISAFVACMRIISGAVCTLPLRVWRVLDDETEEIANDHPLDNVLNNQPNDEVSAADLFQTGQGHLLLTGNCYLEKAYNGAGQPAALYLRNPFRTIPYRFPDGTLFYKTNDTSGGYERNIMAEDMIHVKGLGMDSLVGLSPVKYYAREVLGNDLAAQSYSAKFFANDSRPGGYLQSDGIMSNDRKQAATQSWIASHSRGQSHRMAVLDGGMKWMKVGVNPDEAQFMQTRRLNREQIGAIFGVPVHFLGENVESRADMEQRGIEFLTYTIKPWLIKWEQAINMKMFPRRGRTAGTYFARFDTTMFERATYANLLKGIQTGRYAGLYTVNEGRKLLNEQPYSQEQHDSKDPADKLWMPINMMYVTESIDTPPTPPGATTNETDKSEGQGGDDQDGGDGGGKPAVPAKQGGKRTADQEIKKYFLTFRPMFRDALGRILNREKPIERDFQKAFQPVLATIAATFSFARDAEPGDMTLDEKTTEFITGYVASMAIRGASWGQNKACANRIAADELIRALKEIRTKCQELGKERDDEQTLEEDDEPSRNLKVNIEPAVVQVTPEINLTLAPPNGTKRAKAVRLPDGSMSLVISQDGKQRTMLASRDKDGGMTFVESENGNNGA